MSDNQGRASKLKSTRVREYLIRTRLKLRTSMATGSSIGESIDGNKQMLDSAESATTSARRTSSSPIPSIIETSYSTDTSSEVETIDTSYDMSRGYLGSKNDDRLLKQTKEMDRPRFLKPTVIVTLSVGDGSREDFHVHQEFACHYSPVLKAAFQGNFIEGQTKRYSLKETSYEAVRLLVNWIYTQTLDLVHIRVRGFSDPPANDSEIERESTTLAYLWILADQLIIPKLQNLIIDVLFDFVKEDGKVFTDPECLCYVYANTSSDSQLRAVILHLCITNHSNPTHTINKEKWPKELIEKIADCYSEGVGYTWRKNKTKYRNVKKFHVGESSKSS